MKEPFDYHQKEWVQLKQKTDNIFSMTADISVPSPTMSQSLNHDSQGHSLLICILWNNHT